MKSKKIVSLLMAVVMVLGSATNIFAAFFEKVTLAVNEDVRAQILTCNNASGSVGWNNFAPAMVTWTHPDTGKPYYAYCVNPALNGQGDNGLYEMDLEKMLDASTIVDAGGSGGSGKSGEAIKNYIWGAITYGYPNKSPQDLGVVDEYAAYYATKMAIWSLIHTNYNDLDSWDIYTGTANAGIYTQEQRKDILKAMKLIATEAKNYTGATTSTTATVMPVGEVQTVGNDLIQEYKVTVAGATGDRYYVDLKANTIGAVLTDASGATKDIKYPFAIGDNFKIKAPEPSTLSYNIEAAFSINVVTDAPVCVFAEPSDPALKDKKQNYVFYGQGAVGTEGTFKAEKGEIPKEPTGEGITIYKYSTETTQGGARIPLQGVVFELVDGSGRSLGTKVTDASGTVNWSPLPLGAYHIYERTNNGLQYQLTPPTYQDIVLTETNPKGTVTFYDDTSTTVRPVKEDAQTGKPIPGVEFELKQIDGNGNFVTVGTTIADGSATFKDVPDGTYSVREVSTVDGYILDSTPQTVVVKNGQATSLKFLNSKYPNISILKQDAQTGETLSSPATFHVQQQNGSFSCDVKTGQTYTVNGATAGVTGTGAPGAANILNLPTGTYTITEKVAPAGYVLDPTPFDIHVVGGQSAQFIATDLKCPTIQIQKLDSETGKPVPGVTFEVKQADGTMVGSYTTGTAGIVLVGLPTQASGYLQPGTYTVTEKAVPPPYEIPKDGSQTQTVVLKAGDVNSVTFYDNKAPIWTIEKIDGQTGKPVTAPTTFHVKIAGGQDIGDFTTDSTGKVIITDQQGKFLPAGTYEVSEKIAPTGYTRTTDVYTVKLDGNKQITTVFENYVKPTITVLKVDQVTGEPLEKAEFRLTERDDASRIINTGFTDKTGKWVTTDLEPGWYSVTELQPPKGYLLAEQPKQNIEIKAGESLTLKFDNLKMPQLTIQKKDAVTGKMLAGAEFQFKQTDGTSAKTYNYTTDSTGTITITDLPLGTYTVEETKAPKNYILDPQHQDVKLEGYDNKTLIFQDTLYPTLVITKTDYTTNKPVPNTTFKVEYENTTGGTELIGTYKTDTDGRIVLPFVKVGWYVLTETIPAQGMQLPSNPVTRIYLNAGTNSYTSTEQGNVGGISSYTVTSGLDYPVVAGVINYPLNSVVIKKADANTGKMLSGATFELIKTSGAISGQNGTVIGTFTTDASGVIVVTDLEGGTYAVRETQAPQNYIIAETSLQTVNMKADGTSIVEVLFRNYPFGNILVTKVDGVTGEPLAGATFKVTNNAGAAVGNSTGEFTTDSQGQFLVSTVEPGSYVVTEIKAPTNYVINTTPKTAQVGTDGGTYKISFDNYPFSSILVTKMDGVTHEPLAGATFKITDAAGKAVGSTSGEYTTNSQGEFSVPNVAPGSYVVAEIKAPDNYAINTTPKTVEVTADAKVYKISFDNYPYGAILITKIDGLTGEPLAGAKFKVVDNTGKVVGNTTGEYTTDSKGEILIQNIAPGSYVVTELQAPANYAINNTPKTIEVGLDGKTYKTSFDNFPYGTLVIKKLDTDTKEPLLGAEFKIATAKGDVVGTGNGYYTTDARGEIVIPNLPKGSYVITETKAPMGYILEQQTKTIDIDYGNSYTLEYFNKKMSSMQIVKIDAQTKQPLKDAEFKVYKMDGQLLGSYKTDGDGLILFDKLEPGWYKILESKAPAGYLIDEVPRDIEITGNQFEKVVFENQPMSSLVVKKFDATTKQPLLGARFQITKKSGDILGEYTTDANGLIKIDNMAPGWYTATEVTAPVGYKLYTGSQDFEIKNTKTVTLEFPNEKLTSLIIKKVDDKSGAPLIGAKFKVEKQNGEIVGEYTTDKDGTINIPTLSPDWYVVRETFAPDGYLLDESPKTVQVKTDVPTVVTFTNKVKSGFQIIKIDAKSGTPLPGARFTVYKKSGDVVGEYTTDNNGVIIIDNLENNWYKIAETKAPDGYLISESPKDVELTGNQFLRVVFENKKMTSLEIKKIDAVSGAPLPGAQFTIEKQNGEKVYTSENGTIFTTDGQGIINIPKLEPDYYIVREVKAPVGYVSDESPKTVQVKTDSPTVVTFENKKMTALQIVKIDGVTGKTLPGAKFTIEKQNGEKIQTNENGTEFTTDGQGLINLPNLPPDYYIVREVKAPEGYIINETPKTVQVKSDSPTIVTIENKPLSGLKIVKINSVTKAPIEGVEFEIAQMNGEKVPNGSNTFRFITDKTGQIYIPSLSDGFYVVTETKAAEGYFLDAQPKTVEVKSSSPTVLEIENKPASGLLIVKTDAKTGKPLQGVVFDVRKADGQRVQSSIIDANQPNTPNNSPNKTTSPNGDISGSYTTDANGRILINTLAPGEYNVVETKALQGYELDTYVHAVTIVPGKQATLQLTNNPMSGLRILKIDSVTKKGIYDVEFRVYDFETNKEVGGPYLTDNNGVIDFTGILPEGRYKIMETREAPGYLRDTLPRTIEFKAGKTLEIVWENSPQMGQVQVTKKSASDNEVNGLPAGTPLAEAVFEIYNYKTGNVMDQFTTGNNGVGVSKPLPTGRYILKEVVSPKYYKISDQQIDFEIEFSSQIVKFEFTNEPANTGVSIKKTGPAETMSGQQIRYDFKVIQNTSTVPLSDFYWRDIIPGNALRLDKVVTGTYNQSLKYKIMYKTNKNDYRVMADNLSTTHNNVVDASPAALGMFSDEYVTEIMFVFGNVKAGFSLVETPQIYATVKSGFPKGFQFANKADIGGKYGQEWIIGNTTWVTTIFASQPEKLPRTGY